MSLNFFFKIGIIIQFMVAQCVKNHKQDLKKLAVSFKKFFLRQDPHRSIDPSFGKVRTVTFLKNLFIIF